MLKAYNYVENAQLDPGISDERIVLEERRVAAEFVRKNPAVLTSLNCVVCGGNECVHFAVIDGIPYQRCLRCYSIFIPADRETVKRYQSYEPLVELRKSDTFQSLTKMKRAKVWDELLFWISFRSARYLNQNTNLNILDYGNYFEGLSKLIRQADFCGNYYLCSSILGDSKPEQPADVALYFDQLRHEMDAVEVLREIYDLLNDDGILFLSTRVGSGFDILTLKDGIGNVYPYEYSLLPSTGGLETLLTRAGFRLLEISTPGMLDVKYVLDSKEKLEESNLFVNYLLNTMSEKVLADFQIFLQKSGTSSHARIVAKKIK